MGNDIEDDWHLLGRGPGKIGRAARSIRRGVMTFLEFVFTWIGHAWDKLWASVGAGWTKFWNADFLLMFFVVLTLSGSLYAISKWVLSDGKTDYCIITESDDPQTTPHEWYVLDGHRNWRADRTLFKDHSKDIVLAWSKTLGCPIH